MGFNDVSFYSGRPAGGTVKTPHIDSLAEEGIAFNNAYADNAVCAPSRAMIMTGRYSTRSGFEFTPTPPAFITMVSSLYAKSNRIYPPVVYKDRAQKAPPYDQGMGVRPYV